MAVPAAAAVAVSLSSSYWVWRMRSTASIRPIPPLLLLLGLHQSHHNNSNNLKFQNFPPSSPLSSSTAAPQIMSSIPNSSSISSCCLFANNDTGNTAISDTTKEKQQQEYVLLFDIMDTIVRDPFYQDIPAFFRMSLHDLLDSKHPTAWVDFELGLIDEVEFARNFFKDGRPLDLEGLKNCVRRGYSYIEGVQELLTVLKQNNYEMHALTNYPIWYKMIEDKLKLSKYLSWSFCSCNIGKRKPDQEFYVDVVRRLNVEAGKCIFIDDRMKNVAAAVESGMVGLQFKDAKMLHHDLSMLGIQTKSREADTVP